MSIAADEWMERVAFLRDEASAALDAEDVEAAVASINEAFDAVTLYARAANVARTHHGAEILLTKALFGLAQADEANGAIEKATSHYREALAILEHSDHPDAALARDAIEDALRRLA